MPSGHHSSHRSSHDRNSSSHHRRQDPQHFVHSGHQVAPHASMMGPYTQTSGNPYYFDMSIAPANSGRHRHPSSHRGHHGSSHRSGPVGHVDPAAAFYPPVAPFYGTGAPIASGYNSHRSRSHSRSELGYGHYAPAPHQVISTPQQQYPYMAAGMPQPYPASPGQPSYDPQAGMQQGPVSPVQPSSYTAEWIKQQSPVSAVPQSSYPATGMQQQSMGSSQDPVAKNDEQPKVATSPSAAMMATSSTASLPQVDNGKRPLNTTSATKQLSPLFGAVLNSASSAEGKETNKPLTQAAALASVSSTPSSAAPAVSKVLGVAPMKQTPPPVESEEGPEGGAQGSDVSDDEQDDLDEDLDAVEEKAAEEKKPEDKRSIFKRILGGLIFMVTLPFVVIAKLGELLWRFTLGAAFSYVLKPLWNKLFSSKDAQNDKSTLPKKQDGETPTQSAGAENVQAFTQQSALTSQFDASKVMNVASFIDAGDTVRSTMSLR